jgi:hypothetical protein
MFKSIRAVSVLLSFGLIYVLLIGAFFGKEPSSTITGLIASVVTGVVIAYFGKRDESKDKTDSGGEG